MYEKISDIPIREEKIKRLKEKIYSEIDEFSSRVRTAIQTYVNMVDENTSKEWDFLITREYGLLRLKEYVQDDNSFQSYINKYTKEGIIVYYISDENLDIWLQDRFNFVQKYLSKIEFNDQISVDDVLDDEYLGHEMTSIFDKIQYKKNLN